MNCAQAILLKTPQYRIPIAEVTVNKNGTVILRIKKSGSNLYETVTLDDLLALIMEAAKKTA